MTVINPQASRYRRAVTIDIETVSLDPNLAKGALDALTGRIVCVGILIDDGTQMTELAIANEDETKILTQFWSTIHATDCLIGFNLIEFDLAFVQRRSWILGIQPTRTLDLRRFYSEHVDLMQVWTAWSFKKFVSLDALGAALNCGQKSAHGEDVATMWATGDLDGIKAYCLEDVRITHRLYCKMMYLPSRIPLEQPKAIEQFRSVALRDIPVAFRRGAGSSQARKRR